MNEHPRYLETQVVCVSIWSDGGFFEPQPSTSLDIAFQARLAGCVYRFPHPLYLKSGTMFLVS
jgi:hypothetical protein